MAIRVVHECLSKEAPASNMFRSVVNSNHHLARFVGEKTSILDTHLGRSTSDIGRLSADESGS